MKATRHFAAAQLHVVCSSVGTPHISACPVKTPIFAKTEELDFSPYRETEYADALEKVIGSTQKLGKDGLEPEEVGNLIVEIFNNASPKTRYPILKSKFSRWTLPRLLPDRLVDRALARRVGIRKRR